MGVIVREAVGGRLQLGWISQIKLLHYTNTICVCVCMWYVYVAYVCACVVRACGVCVCMRMQCVHVAYVCACVCSACMWRMCVHECMHVHACAVFTRSVRV